MNVVNIEIKKDQERDTETVFVCEVSDDYAESGEFDFVAPKGFLSLTEQEIVETVLAHDTDAADVLQAAVQNGTAVYLNGSELSPEAVRAAWDARTAPGPR